jgi:subtilase family serine protease
VGSLRGCVSTLLLFFGFAIFSFGQSAETSRIVEAVDDSQRTMLHGNTHTFAQAEFDQGRMEAAAELSHVAMAFKLSAAQQQDLDTLLAEQQDPKSPNYHKWLTPDEFAARFGMSQSDLDQVTNWLEGQGFTVDGVARNRNEIYFSGTAGQIESAFQIELHNYLVDGEMHYANAGDPAIPKAFAGVVLGLRHLDNFRPKPRVVKAKPSVTSSQSGNHFVAPGDFVTIYDLQALYTAGFDGTGVKLAIMGQTSIVNADLDAFRTAAGLPARTASNFQQVLVPLNGTPTVSTGDLVEASLDLEWSEAIAKNANIIYVNATPTATNGVWDALQYATTNGLAPVISTSYGFCEPGNGQAFAMTVQTWVQNANALGSTVVSASGDQGAADCDSKPPATGGLAVDVPASIPEVTGMGGTEFTGDAAATVTSGCAAATQYWGQSCSLTSGASALSYIPEMTWNDSSSSSFGATGGGVSAFFAKPTWQTGAGVPNDGMRDVPDISLNSSNAHDPYLICSQEFYTVNNLTATTCTSGFRASDQSFAAVGGTSVAAPTFAGILAILNQGLGANGLGNINPNLYSLSASTPSAFHDITSGNNKVICTAGTPTTGSAAVKCPAAGTFGYSAGPGYDQVTGLGSIDANVLATHWTTKVASTTTLTAPTASVATGASVTFTATVTPATSGGFSPSGGTVQFAIDGTNVGTATALSTNQATYTTSTLTAGAHSVTAVYNGNLAFSGSTSTAFTETVVTPTFSLAPNPTALTLSAGATSGNTSTITLTTTAGFSGMVSLGCAPSSTTAQITCSMTPTTLTGNGSSVLTVTTAAPHAITNTSAGLHHRVGFGWLAATGGGMLAVVVLLGVPARRRNAVVLGMVAFVSFSAILSCGGGSATTPPPPSPPAAPANLSATPGTGQVMLSWNASTGATGYNVKRAGVSGGPYTGLASMATTSYTDAAVTGGIPYYYVVTAVNSAGESAISNQATATPKNAGTPAGAYTITVTATNNGVSQTAMVSLTVQ